MRAWILAAAALLLWPASSRGDQPGELHLVYTSDVRGTVGICG
ncbi:MAG: hypothetical protein SCH98_17710 [Deferrisomatales bacterium]|nr:hypothetical protein [Deferrisomatales bacterium]